ncbi:glycosyltransferase family 4 protein [Ureibacillus aquaedulcis]|uniref:Glycosyltransferase family 4 protein n=1 Tax=Ureibacillus aquaedulcis TaxID=3058421 RepID=A0ABT8GW52_9BACL|nr:glycosyltransferase family 4 protein [Ureibacillus sp. BA0131]MDN4495146.1 glycosyltransferase family 4 protein [Ureibacillus sp. BA0131]
MKTIWFISHGTMPPHMEVRMRTHNLSKYLVKKGYRVEVFSVSTIHNTNKNLIDNKGTLYIEEEYDGVLYNFVRTSNYTGNGLKRIFNMLQFPLRLYKVSRKKKIKPDVIVCNPQSIFAIIPYFISKNVNSKFISEVRDLWPESVVAYKLASKNNPIIKLLYVFEKWIYKKAGSIIFTMEGGKDYVLDKGWGKEIDISKIHHINNGVDLEMFNYNKENFRINDSDLENPNTFKVVYAGSIRLANNVKKIIDAAQVIKEQGYQNIKFLIYGEGSDREYLMKYCDENRIDNVIFKGFIEKNKIPFILSKGDLNIMHFGQNSLKKYGISLNKMFEYFASGRPTLSDCEVGYDLIKKYNCGLVVDNANSEKLAEAIIAFNNIPAEKYEAFCNNALKAAKDYDFKILTEKLEKLL